jgi:ribosomal protein S18 acetylase RimI-like enzyme
MVITLPASQSGNGPRIINPNKDLPQLIELLRLVFSRELAAEGQQLFRNLPDSHTPAVFWRFDPALARLSPGYVWEIDDRIVGNVTLLPTRSHNRYLVANVAVHPNFRQRGIARMLMGSIEEEVYQRQGSEIFLQVDHDNETAIHLYRSMGYEVRGSMSSWRTSASRVRDLALEVTGRQGFKDVRKFERNRWKEAYRLDCDALPPDLNWPDALDSDAYKKGLWQRATDFINGRFEQTWMTVDGENNLSGLATIFSEWGRPHQLNLRAHPSCKGQVEGLLLQKLIDKLRTLSRRNVQLIHLADDEVVNRLLSSANFSRRRTLTHMRLTLKR